MNKLIILITISAIISGCSQEPPPVPEPESRPVKLFTVSVGKAQFERYFPATTVAGDRVVLAFRVPGLLQSIEVNEGRVVKKGDVLAALNPDEYSLTERQARANFVLAEVQYKRYKKLLKDQVVSAQEFDEAKANYKSASADWEQARANLRYTTLIAPYDGTISYISAENHEYIPATKGVMNIQSNQVMKVIFQLPDHLLNFYTMGKNVSAQMIFDVYPERAFDLTFQEVDTEVDPKTGSYKVTMMMEGPQDLGILPGMSGNVHLVSQDEESDRIPDSALVEENGKTYVWRVNKEGVAARAEIQVNEKGQILQGLEDGDRIIVSGLSVIEPGIKVRAWVKERGL